MESTFIKSTVTSFRRTTDTMLRLLDKAETFATDQAINPKELLTLRLTENMHPFSYQVKSVRVHSQGAIEGVRRGLFSPDETPPPDSFFRPPRIIKRSTESLSVVTTDEIDALSSRPMVFQMGKYRAGLPAKAFF